MTNSVTHYARTVTLAALFLIPFTPLIVANSLFFPFIVGKAIFFRVLVEIAFFGWAVLALFDSRYRPRDSSIMFAFLLFTVWLFAANLFAVNPVKAFWGNFERMEGWVNTIHLFIFFVVFGSMSLAYADTDGARRGTNLRINIFGIKIRDSWSIFWVVSFGVSVAVSVIAFVGTENAPGVLGGARAVGTLGNPIYLAAYNLVHIFMAVFFFARSRNKLDIHYSPMSGYFFIAAALVNALTLLFSGTRGTMIGLAGGAMTTAVLLFAAKYRGKRVSFSRGGAGKTAVFASGLLLAMLGVFALSRLPVLENLPVFSRIASISVSAGKPRLTIWTMALEGAKDRPLFGWGQEGYNYVFNTYYKPSLFTQDYWFDRAHNDYLDWLIAGGVPALLLYSALFWFALRAIWKFEEEPTRAALVGLVVAYAVHSLFEFNTVTASFLFAAVLVYPHMIRSRYPKKMHAEHNHVLGEMGYLRLIGVSMLICGTIAIFFVNGRILEANRELMRALVTNDAERALGHFKRALAYGFSRQEIREQMVVFASRLEAEPSIPVSIKDTMVHTALTEMTKQIAETPRDARAYVFRATTRQRADDTRGAWDDFEKARERSPRKQAFFLEQGRLAYHSGERQYAAELFARAYALDTSFSETAAYAAAGLITTGQIEEGQLLLRQFFNTPFPNHPFVEQAYRDASNTKTK